MRHQIGQARMKEAGYYRLQVASPESGLHFLHVLFAQIHERSREAELLFAGPLNFVRFCSLERLK